MSKIIKIETNSVRYFGLSDGLFLLLLASLNYFLIIAVIGQINTKTFALMH